MQAKINLLAAEAVAFFHRLGLVSGEPAKRAVLWLRSATQRGWLLLPDRVWMMPALGGLASAPLYGLYALAVWWFVVPPCTDPAFSAVIASMQQHREDWLGDAEGYARRLVHTSGVHVSLGDYSDHLWVGDVGDEHIPSGCRARIRRETEQIIDYRERMEAEQAAREITKAL